MSSDKIIQYLARDLQPVRRLRGVEQRTLLWGGFALSCVSIGTYVLGARPDLSQKIRDPAYLCESALLLVLIFVFSARSAFHLSVPGAERSKGARMLPLLGLLLWACLIAAHSGHSPSGAADSINGWPCIWRMTGLALAPALAVLLMVRRAAPSSPGWTGWFALLSACSLAMLGTQILCANDDPRHLLIWHFGAVLVAGLVGIYLGRWLLTRAHVRRVIIR